MTVRILIKNEPNVLELTGPRSIPRVGDFIQIGETSEKLVVDSVTWVYSLAGDVVEVLTSRVRV